MHIVIGAGEVGTAVAAALSRAHDVVLRDVEPIVRHAEYLHICFPWSDSFLEHVKGYQEEHGAGTVIVYSTVPVGTCDSQGWTHSPVTGKHPHLEESVLTFRRVCAGKDADVAAKIWSLVSDELEVTTLDRAADSEAAKIWELIQYGVQVRVEKAIAAWCDVSGVSYDHVYTQSALNYNLGYTQLGHSEYVRPVLRRMPGPIGGHCVVQNALMIDHELSRMVVEWDDY